LEFRADPTNPEVAVAPYYSTRSILETTSTATDFDDEEDEKKTKKLTFLLDEISFDISDTM